MLPLTEAPTMGPMRRLRGLDGGAVRPPTDSAAVPPWPALPSHAWIWGVRLGLALVLAVLLGYLPYRLYVRSGMAQYLTLQAQLQALRAGNQKLRQDNRLLRMELLHVKGDDQAIEGVARDELGLVRQREIVFKVEGLHDAP